MLDLRIVSFLVLFTLPASLPTAAEEERPSEVISESTTPGETPVSGEQEAAVSSRRVDQPALPSPPTPAEREKTVRAYAALMAIVGIAFAGLGLIALTIIGARRLRRVSKSPLPSADLKQELWFLRPPKRPLRGNSDTPETPPPSQHL